MNVAIKGHPKRGNEVIEILEMLGGNNKYHINTTECNLLYTIREGDDVIIATYPNSSISKIYTLEEFLEEYPYKVGDKILYKVYGIYSKIKSMLWNKEKEQVFYRLESNKLFVATVDELNQYKVETMERKYNVEEYLEVWEETEKGLEVVVNNNFELKEDNGKFYIIKKQLQYPKTYKECCRIIDYYLTGATIIGYEKPLLENLQRLLICRDAYWKIAGDEMGLDKPWEPDWNHNTEKYVIYSYQYLYSIDKENYRNTVLAFPTEEMRDAFYENFKDLIEQCKELL